MRVDQEWSEIAKEAAQHAAWGLAARACLGAIAAGTDSGIDQAEITDGLRQAVEGVNARGPLDPEWLWARLTLPRGRSPTRDGLLLLIAEVYPFDRVFGSQRQFADLVGVHPSRLAGWLFEARRRAAESAAGGPATSAADEWLHDALSRYHLPYQITAQIVVRVVAGFVEWPPPQMAFTHPLTYPGLLDLLAGWVLEGQAKLDVPDQREVPPLLAAFLAIGAKALHNAYSHSYPGPLKELLQDLASSAAQEQAAESLWQGWVPAVCDGLRLVIAVFEKCLRVLPASHTIRQWLGRTHEELAWWSPDAGFRGTCLGRAARCYADGGNLSRCIDVLASHLPCAGEWADAVRAIQSRWGEDEHGRGLPSEAAAPRLLLRYAIRYRRCRRWPEAQVLVQQSLKRLGPKESQTWRYRWRRGYIMARVTQLETATMERHWKEAEFSPYSNHST